MDERGQELVGQSPNAGRRRARAFALYLATEKLDVDFSQLTGSARQD